VGREQAGRRSAIRICAAFLIVVLVSGCSLRVVEMKEQQAAEHLIQSRKLVAQGDYQSALRESEKAISAAPSSQQAEEALLYMGLIYADPANPKKDYGKSMSYVRKLLKDYPGSRLTAEARTIAALLQESERLNRSIEKLNGTIEKLNSVIEESKKVDIGIEEKKREQTK
jgi:outer membrane protein assembly factor BamD (BamD/ComL family)